MFKVNNKDTRTTPLAKANIAYIANVAYPQGVTQVN